MFDEEMKKAYQKTAAPAELKERVMKNYQAGNAKSSNVRLYKTLQAMAASLVLIVSVTAFSNHQGNKVLISMDGNQLTAQPMVLMSENAGGTEGVAMASFGRMAADKICVPLEIDVSSESTISVSVGEMQIYAAVDGELLFAGTEYTAKEDVSVKWYVEKQMTMPENEKEMQMSVSQKGTKDILQLEYVQTDDSWVIYER